MKAFGQGRAQCGKISQIYLCWWRLAEICTCTNIRCNCLHILHFCCSGRRLKTAWRFTSMSLSACSLLRAKLWAWTQAQRCPVFLSFGVFTKPLESSLLAGCACGDGKTTTKIKVICFGGGLGMGQREQIQRWFFFVYAVFRNPWTACTISRMVRIPMLCLEGKWFRGS